MAERTIAIVGLGLMGGSLGLALKRATPAPRVLGVDVEPAVLQRAIEVRAVDSVASLEAACIEADVLVLAAPLGAVVDIIDRNASLLARVPLVTDVASVKRPVIVAAERAGIAGRFVGAHPVCGRERSGIDAALGDLYDDALVWITPASAAAPAERAAELWRSVRARPRTIDPAEHDRLMARISHTPQVVASALAAALARVGADADQLGPGGRDTTRIAASPEPLWAEILIANASLVLEPVDAVLDVLESLRAAIAAADADAIAALLREARVWRERARTAGDKLDTAASSGVDAPPPRHGQPRRDDRRRG